MRDHGLTIVVTILLVFVYLILGSRIQLFGVAPSFLLILTACVGSLEGSNAGCVCGFLCGLVLDLMGTDPLGITALVMCVFGFIYGAIAFMELREGWVRPIVMFIACDAVYGLTRLAIAAFNHGLGEVGWSVVTIFFASLLADALIALLLFIILSRALARFRLAAGGLSV
ncbi:MAG: rod shape-determining protein MreD [Coriobacteriales bacterium]|nr:rod shape-determining protein MreD [Coriobacteriales bacterium]